MKSIKTKLIISFGMLIILICVGLGIISFINSSNALESNLEKTLPKIVEETASNIEGRIKGKLNSLESIAARTDISDPNNSVENKMEILVSETERLGSTRLGIADQDGIVFVSSDGKTSNNISKNDFFQKAMSGKSNTSDPSISKSNGNAQVVNAVPIKRNNKIIGVLIEARDGNYLSELTDKLKLGQTGTAFMINSKGTTIANSNKDLVLQMDNTIENSKNDAKLQGPAEIHKKMIAGELGIAQYNYEGIDKFAGYAPINGTDWSVGIAVYKSEIMSELDSLKFYVLMSSLVIMIISISVIYIIAKDIANGIKSISAHLELLAEGNLCEEIPAKYLKSKNEIGIMTVSMKSMQESLGKMIKKVKENSLNINGQSENLSAISEEIASVSQNVTEAISEVAKGTSNQSEELIHITEILNEFSNKLSEMVSEIQVVDSNSREISLMANDSSKEMNELNQSVSNISDSFKEFNSKIKNLGKDINEINEITNIINSVAEQTNLLALNAAIEAARAGEAGKGFSVVAEEIRKLAEQSKESSENISKLISGISKNSDAIIQDSVTVDEEMIKQVTIIDNSVTSFRRIIQAIDEVIPKIETVKDSAENIEKHKNSILTRVDGLASISVEVSASAEEISASSEEMNASTEEVASSAQILSNMTDQMMEEVNRFKI